jgi:hypothetical protein
LYNVDANNEPTTIAARKVPKWNSLAFFTVSEKSFHKVDEVVTPVKGRSRSSLGGWFHGTPTKRPERKQSVLPPFHAPSAAEYKLEDWLTRDYRRPNTMKQLLAHFLEESSIEIDNFMRADKYAELTAALEAAEEAKWSAVGPVNKQKFSEYTTGEETKTDVLADFQGFMLSKVFTDYLSKITGLDSSICWSQLRRFQVGDYTLGHDTDPELQECGLEGSFSCLPKSYGK